MHATTVQRFMRGYRVSQHEITKIRREKLNYNLGHFAAMREKLEHEASVKIQFYIRKVVLPRRMEEKMRAAKKGAKGKKKNAGRQQRGNNKTLPQITKQVMDSFEAKARVAAKPRVAAVKGTSLNDRIASKLNGGGNSSTAAKQGGAITTTSA